MALVRLGLSDTWIGMPGNLMVCLPACQLKARVKIHISLQSNIWNLWPACLTKLTIDILCFVGCYIIHHKACDISILEEVHMILEIGWVSQVSCFNGAASVLMTIEHHHREWIPLKNTNVERDTWSRPFMVWGLLLIRWSTTFHNGAKLRGNMIMLHRVLDQEWS